MTTGELVNAPRDGMAAEYAEVAKNEVPSLVSGWDVFAHALRQIGTRFPSADDVHVWRAKVVLRALHPDGFGMAKTKKADPTPAQKPAWLRNGRFSLHWLPFPHIERRSLEGFRTADGEGPSNEDMLAFAGLIQFFIEMGHAPYLREGRLALSGEPPVWLSDMLRSGENAEIIPFKGTPHGFADIDGARGRQFALLVMDMRRRLAIADAMIANWERMGVEIGRDVSVLPSGEVAVTGEGPAMDVVRDDVFSEHDALSCQLRFGRRR